MTTSIQKTSTIGYVPAGTDVRQASDELLRLALDVEDQYGVTILTRGVQAKGAGA